jgi:DNA-binding GntR family transcriptional regulator
MEEKQIEKPERFNHIQTSMRRSDQVFEALKDAITAGKIAPGEWLRQDALAKEMGVSQITVREALSRLTAEGLAYFEPYKGVRTFTITMEDLDDVYEMRAMLEGRAMELAAQRITTADLERMRLLIPESVWKAGSGQGEPAREANREFHWIAIQSSGRQHLSRILGNIWGLIDPYFIFSPSMLRHMSNEKKVVTANHIEHEHIELLAALEARDGKLARRLTTESIDGALEVIRELHAQSNGQVLDAIGGDRK